MSYIVPLKFNTRATVKITDKELILEVEELLYDIYNSSEVWKAVKVFAVKKDKAKEIADAIYSLIKLENF